MKTVNVAIAGLGFGAEFIPIYKSHPDADCLALCRRDKRKLSELTEQFNVEKGYSDFKEMLADTAIDAVHINTPIADHGWMSIAALKAGKHVACTVPMALKREECAEIVEVSRRKNLVYMMMETAVYTREFLYVKDLRRRGELGEIQFLRGSHQQNMGLPGWPEYWYGFPPMHYATHAIGPLAALLERKVKSVRCFGSGLISEEYAARYQSPFAVETAHLSFHDSRVKGEVTRSLFDTIRQYRESFDVYGSKSSFEWAQLEDEDPVVFTGCEDAARVTVPDALESLPPQIRKFGQREEILDETHVSFVQGAGHGGSHPHLAHEFITAVMRQKAAAVDAAQAANWTLAGVLAHESALNDGKLMDVPIY